MARTDYPFCMVHDDAAQTTTLLVGANRDRFDVAGVESTAVVTQSSGHDGGESDQRFIVVEHDVHSVDGMQPVVGSELRSECSAHQRFGCTKLGCAEFARLGYQHLNHEGRVSCDGCFFVARHGGVA